MNTINERIQIILESLNMTKTEFAKKNNVTQQYISKIVRTGNPSDMFVNSVCTKFGINEVWLRTGEGGDDNMFVEMDSDDRYSISLGRLSTTENDFVKNAVNALAESDPDKLKIIEEFMKNCLGLK